MKLSGLLLLAVCLFSCGNDSKESTVSSQPAVENSIIPIENQTATEKKLTPVMKSYYALKDALVEADSALADQAATELLSLTDSLKFGDILDDSSLSLQLETYTGNIAAETRGFLGENDLTEKRRAFFMISQNLLPLLKDMNYRASAVYQQICPMAFNDNEEAFWLNNSAEIVNPYLGKKHPKYAAGMLHCGELGDSLLIKK